ncbi:hypothetical protein GCM10009077_26160 [Roseibium denhamense]
MRPTASAPNIKDLWEMDLSPGTLIVPVRGAPALEVSGKGEDSCDILNVRDVNGLSKGASSYHEDAMASSVRALEISATTCRKIGTRDRKR